MEGVLAQTWWGCTSELVDGHQDPARFAIGMRLAMRIHTPVVGPVRPGEFVYAKPAGRCIGPATLLSVVKPLFIYGVQIAGRTVTSHSMRGHALIKPRVGREVAPDRGSASRRKVNPKGDSLGLSQTHGRGFSREADNGRPRGRRNALGVG